MLFVYSWMILQRDGILGAKHRLYINSLAVSCSNKDWCELGLTLYGANLLVLGPLVIFLMLSKHGVTQVSNLPFVYVV